MSNNDAQKEQIAGLYHRVASAYGHIGPGIFIYAGRHLVERLGMAEGAQVLDVGAGRGANLFPAAETVGPHGQVIGIDLAPGMVRETTAEIKRRICPFRALVAFVGYFRRKDVDPVRPRLLPPHPMTSVTLFVTFP